MSFAVLAPIVGVMMKVMANHSSLRGLSWKSAGPWIAADAVLLLIGFALGRGEILD